MLRLSLRWKCLTAFVALMRFMMRLDLFDVHQLFWRGHSGKTALDCALPSAPLCEGRSPGTGSRAFKKSGVPSCSADCNQPLDETQILFPWRDHSLPTWWHWPLQRVLTFLGPFSQLAALPQPPLATGSYLGFFSPHAAKHLLLHHLRPLFPQLATLRAYRGYAVFLAESCVANLLVPGQPGTSSATMRKPLSLFFPKADDRAAAQPMGQPRMGSRVVFGIIVMGCGAMVLALGIQRLGLQEPAVSPLVISCRNKVHKCDGNTSVSNETKELKKFWPSLPCRIAWMMCIGNLSDDIQQYNIHLNHKIFSNILVIFFGLTWDWPPPIRKCLTILSLISPVLFNAALKSTARKWKLKSRPHGVDFRANE
eukprot:s101_g34.t1